MASITIDSKRISHETLADEIFELAKQFVTASEAVAAGAPKRDDFDVDSDYRIDCYHDELAKQRNIPAQLLPLLEEVRTRLQTTRPIYTGDISVLKPIKSALLRVPQQDINTVTKAKHFSYSAELSSMKRIANAIRSHAPVESIDAHPWNFE